MTRRSYVKIGRRAEYAGRYTPNVNPADGYVGDGGDGGDGGTQGPPGADGKDGEGVPKGGATGQILAKKTAKDFDTEWVDTTDGDADDRYVHTTGGDHMEGPLQVTGGRTPNANGLESTVIALNVDSGQSSTLDLKWHGNTKIYVGDKQSTFNHDIKFNVGGHHIYAEGSEKKGFVINNSGVFYDGNYTVDRHVATKANVDAAFLNDPTDPNSYKFLRNDGDTMHGELEMQGHRIVFNQLPADSQVIRVNRAAGTDVDLLYLAHNGGQVQGFYDITMTGNTSYNGIRFKGGSGGEVPIFEMRANGNHNIFYSDLKFDGNRILELGDAVDDTDAVPYGQVKREVSEAFEEITATLSFGNFSYIATSAARGPGVLTSFGAYPSTNGQKNPANVGSLGVHHTAGDDSEVGWSSLNPGDIIRWTRGTNVWQFRVNGTPQSQDSGDNLWYQIPVNKGTGPTFIESGIGNFDYTLQVLRLTGGSPDLTDYLKLDGTSDPITGSIHFGHNSLTSVKDIEFHATAKLLSNGKHKLTIQNPVGSSGAGVQVERPGDAKRGFAIRGTLLDNVETDLLYSYHNPVGTEDRILYRGAVSSDSSIQTKASVLDLIASGGIGGDGTAFQRHGPYNYRPGNPSIGVGEFSANSEHVKDIREFTFHRKNINNEDQIWSDLAIGEVLTIVQESGGYFIQVNYCVEAIQNYSTASIVSVTAHQTIVAYSDGHVLYNPDAFRFQENTDTFVIESQPANLNTVLDLAKKASPGPGYLSYRMDTGTGEPIRGVEHGMMISSGSSNIQSPTRFIFSKYDYYGNGHNWGNNNFNCPGSIVELYQKNKDGTLCLCRIYEFNRVECLDTKFEFVNLVEKHLAPNNNGNITNPGVITAGAEYLIKYQFNFSSSIYTLDAEGDPHYGDHRLEDVGHPVAATDAATKGYVDNIYNTRGLPVYRYAEKQMETLQNGEFVCFDSSNNYTKLLGAVRHVMWKGVDANGNRPMRDADAINWEGNLNSTFSLLTDNGTKTIMRVSMSQVVNGHPRILYNAHYDVYCISWSGGDSTVNTSTMTSMTNSQSVSFQCSELFF